MPNCQGCYSLNCKIYGCASKQADAALDSFDNTGAAAKAAHKHPTLDEALGCNACQAELSGLTLAKAALDSFAEPVKPNPVKDAVNHPAHYTAHPSGIECIQVTESMSFTIGNAIKYLWRAGIKSEAAHVEDLRKAVWYIEREISRLERTK